jgi:succinate-semialdehyde dehydrogenase/glutarate-semialdehyde dehydrogenase
MKLKDPLLLRELCFIDGAWAPADNGGTLAVHNPATTEKLGLIPNMGAAECRRAIAAAAAALPAWAARTAKDRAAALRRWFDLMLVHQEDLAMLMTAEQGKPLAESKGEIVYAASFIEWFAEEAKRIYGDIIPGHQTDKRILVLRQPVGVVAAITPWNFPAAMITRKAGPALAEGRIQRHHGICGRDRRRDDVEPHRTQSDIHRIHRNRQEADGAMRRYGEKDIPRTRRQRAIHRL